MKNKHLQLLEKKYLGQLVIIRNPPEYGGTSVGWVVNIMVDYNRRTEFMIEWSDGASEWCNRNLIDYRIIKWKKDFRLGRF